MIEKWEIKDIAQNKKALLIKGDFKDILSIVKKLGPILSRPERLLKGDYTFIMYLLEDGIEDKINKAMNEIIGKVTKGVKKITNQVSKESQKIEEKNLSENNLSLDIPMPDLEVKSSIQDKKDDSTRIIPNSKGPLFPKATQPKDIKEEEKPKENEETKKAKITVPPSPNISQRSIDRLKLRWSIELPLNPTMSFQTLITGSHNRFAHAASMAVVENPGVMYNPILIWGPMGSGKSHFIHSMSYGLSSIMGQKNIFVTNGVKFSVGVTIAIKEGFLSNIAQFIENSKVIIVDDIHLMLINKENKDFISKVISNCMQSNKQVVFSSLFSPKELEPLEAMLGIEISQGWMVDIKPPNPQSYRAVLNQIIGNMDVRLSEEHIKRFFVSKSLDFRTATVMLFRMKKLEKYISSINPSLLHQDLLDMLFGEKDDLSAPTPQEIKGANFYTSSTPDSFYKWGIFYPKDMKDYVKYVYFKMSQISSNVIGTDLTWYNVFEEEYDPDEVYGIPFKIGSYVLEKNVNGVIVIGPPPTSALSAKEIEFRHLVDKILESLNIKTAWIYSNRLKATSNYLNAILDLI
ncbi:MAG: DnaA/Hda family protein [Elusimicrobiales bacterium]|nr:DnaA/Hda family protein [Elusimicrobiales bacterium]